MILVDTSVWIDHLRSGDAALADRLNRSQVLTHPFVLGEIALGNLANRATVLGALAGLPTITVASDAEALAFIDAAPLHGLGIGHIDAHLLAAVRLTPGAILWTRDRRLGAAAAGVGVLVLSGV